MASDMQAILLAPGAFFMRFAESSGAEPVAERYRTLAGQAGMVVVGPPLAESDPL